MKYSIYVYFLVFCFFLWAKFQATTARTIVIRASVRRTTLGSAQWPQVEEGVLAVLPAGSGKSARPHARWFQIKQEENRTEWSLVKRRQMIPALRKVSLPRLSPFGGFWLSPLKPLPVGHLPTPFLILLSQAPSVCWQLWVLKLVLPPGIPANGRSPNSTWPRIQLHPQKCIFARSFSLHFAR